MQTYLRDTIIVAHATKPTPTGRHTDIQDEGLLEIIELLDVYKERVEGGCRVS